MSHIILIYSIQICTELGLCTSNVQRIEQQISEVLIEDDSSEEEDEEDRPYCMMCEYVVGEIDRLVADNKTEEYIQKTLEQVCHLLRYVMISNIIDKCVF